MTVCPRIMWAAGEHRKATTPATSSGVTRRPAGMALRLSPVTSRSWVQNIQCPELFLDGAEEGLDAVFFAHIGFDHDCEE